jgi:hypothetical protein
VRLADQIVLLVNGTAVVGSPDALRQDSDPRIAEFLNEEVDDTLALSSELHQFDPERPPIL